MLASLGRYAHAGFRAACRAFRRRHADVEPCPPPSGCRACAHEDGDIRAVAADLPRAPRNRRQLREGRAADESPRRDGAPGEVARLAHDRRVRKDDGEIVVADVKLQKIIFHVHATLT